MDKLFLKISRIGSKRKVIAWTKCDIGAYSRVPTGFRMTNSEAGEFHFLETHEKHESIGAGGQFTYKVYDLVCEPEGDYALVRPHIATVREQYPHACRLVNMRNAHESALCDNETIGRMTLRNAVTKALKGSFR